MELRRLQPLAFDLLLRQGDPVLPGLWHRALIDSADPPMLAGRPREWRDPAMVRGLMELRAVRMGLPPPSRTVAVISPELGAVELPAEPPSALAETLFQRHFASRIAETELPAIEAPPSLGIAEAIEEGWRDPAAGCASMNSREVGA